jgi:thiaminase
MKKNKNNIIQDWLDKHSTKEIQEQVKKEIENGATSPLVNTKT